MNSGFDPSNAVAVSETSQGSQPADTGNFTVENAVSVDTDNQGNTPWDSFRQSGEPSTDKPQDSGSTGQLQPNQDQPKDVSHETSGVSKSGKTYKEVQGPSQYPDEGLLNGFVHSLEGVAWNTIAKPLLGMNDPDVDKYLSDIEKQHPIAATIAGTAPYIATAPFFPNSLIGISSQFATVAGLSATGKARSEDDLKPIGGKILDIAKATAEGASFGPIWHYSKPLGWLGRAMTRGAGTTTLSAIYGDNITEAFKQGGIIAALSLIFENPILAKTSLGRGTIARVNKNAYETMFGGEAATKIAQTSKPTEINPDGTHQDIREKILDSVNTLSGQVYNKPKIVAATVRLPDGTEIHGASHEDALNKMGKSKDNMVESNPLPDVTFEEGFDNQTMVKVKNIKNVDGKKVGTVLWSAKDNPKQVDEEGIDIDITDQRKGYGTSAINHIFNSGMDSIQGDVSKLAPGAQAFWKAIGAKLTQTDSGNFKMYLTKEDFVKATQQGRYQAGFTVLNADGSQQFITREQSMQEPYNLPTGHSEDVQGLNESKWMPPAEGAKVVNPDTLSMIQGNEGKIDINMIPLVPETAEVLQESHKELKEKFAPYEIGQEGQHSAEVLRENLGLLARNNDRLEASLEKARNLFEKANKDSSLDFIYRMEEGQAQADQSLQKVADVLRNLLDTKRDEVIGLGTGKLEHWIENYFPHVWEDPDKVGNIVKRMLGKRPFEGTKSFLKKRTIPTTREGIDLGLTPVSYNPIDSVMLKVREMERYIMAHRTIQALKEQGIIKFVRTGEKGPDGFVPIDDRFATVTYKNDAKELVLAGKYVAQKDAARILNNYLSPGLRGKSYIYDMYRGAGNTLNQFQLGISAFHLGFTSMDATISKFALGINRLSTGDFAGAIKEFGKAPFAPITNILQGRELLQSWYGKDNGVLTNTIADLMASAGGRAKMDKFYATGIKDSMQKAMKEGKIATAAFKVPFYIVEQVARPIMEYIVPRQKMGVFMDLMKMEMERNPGMTHEQMRGIAQRAWNSVDNRMGQLVYDNLFWNRTTKDLAMASVRSLGWNLGTIREIGGGVKDVFGNVQDVIHGKGTQMSYRTAYVMALPIVTGLYGAIYQYLHTGQGPQELKDYFFPKSGGIDNKGQEARVSLPTYMKDIYHYTTNPVQTVINKFSPVNNTVLEMLNNKDFYGVQIRNVDDPAMQQIADESKFMASQFLPFGFRNLGRDTRKTAGSKIEPFIGITPAPYDINMTAAEKEAYELEKGKIPVGSRTKEQAQHSQNKSKLRSDFIATKDRAPLDEAVDSGVISSKERNQLVKESGMTNLQRMTQHLTFEEVAHIMKKATPDEMQELQNILEKKRAGKESRGTWTDAEEELYAKSLKSAE